MKKNLRKKSMLNNALVKTIPLSVAISLLTAGTAFGAPLNGTIVVDKGDGTHFTFKTEWLATNQDYRAKVLAHLRELWLNAQPIYIGDQGGTHFTDFSKNASFGQSLEEVKAESNANGVVVDLANPDELLVFYDENTIY
ncbi:MAG: hypothetical protein LBS84_00315 [Clostridiales bacterium]|nr:hypothetical protein [Clostridiales bacterium]